MKNQQKAFQRRKENTKTHKYCPRCKETKNRFDFWKDSSQSDGLYSCCKSCQIAKQRTEKGKEISRKARKRYNSSIKGIARQFRSNYGYSEKDSFYLAEKCVNDFQRCNICGVPCWFLKIQKIYLRGNSRKNRRLQIDHIIPFNGKNSFLENTRILCNSCNDLRRNAKVSDETVLRQIRRWYRENYYLKLLYWLNEEPGNGGTLFRNKVMQSKAFKLLGSSGLTDQMNLQIQMS